MGYQGFHCTGSAKTAAAAYEMLTTEAEKSRAKGGTIAMTDGFKMVTARVGETGQECMNRCWADRTHWCNGTDKVACLDLGADAARPGNHRFLFWGMAYDDAGDYDADGGEDSE